jgi:hypothetical protein
MNTPRDALEGLLLGEGYSAAADALSRGLRLDEAACLNHWNTFFSSGSDVFHDPAYEGEYFTAPRQLTEKPNLL